ncbi:LytR family transcriptional regulator [Bacillus thuringiensis]|uniref:polyisoprenyl-teichoic acid--peptidoglycan teichoic acid transferase TagU n=1 Tax=Bacillus thuringiensis TaxID=1428 RepID=UPI0034598337
MKKQIVFWILGILAIFIIGGSIYAYHLYSTASKTLDTVHQPLKRDSDSHNPNTLKINTSKPISLLLIGADEHDQERGRSDSLQVITLNPQNSSMKTLSIPRDTYTEIVGKGNHDKINHAYAFGGIDMSVATVEKFLGIPIDYYIEVNMKGFQELVDAFEGVDVHNDLDFSLEGFHFKKGTIHLNGHEALAFTRMRKEDPRGDFGRQMRQRQVIQALIKKGDGFSLLTNYNDLLAVIQKNVKTNISQNQMLDLQKNYKNCLRKNEDLQISGTGHKAANGIWYYYVPEQIKQDVTNTLKTHLELPTP